MKKENNNNSHSEFSPSGLYRIEACPGSHALSKGLERKDSKWSIEGTDAHKCLDAFVQNRGKSPLSVRVFLYKMYPAAMVDHAFDTWFLIERMLKNSGDVLHAEEKIDISHFTRPGEKGTVDVAIVQLFHRLLVIDYKYGAGVVVDVVENLQGIAYALGYLKVYDYNFAFVEVMIIQPRAFHKDGPVRSWVFPIEEAPKYEARIQKAVNRALRPNAPRVAGSHCRFCAAKDICTEFEDGGAGYSRRGIIGNYKKGYKNPFKTKGEK